MRDILKSEVIKEHLAKLANAVEHNNSTMIAGEVTKITGMKIEASGLSVPMGTACQILVSDNKILDAEVIGFSKNITYLMSLDDIHGIKQGTPVIPVGTGNIAHVGMSLLGRIIDAQGHPIDNGKPVETDETYSLSATPINPLRRKRISEPLDVGIRAINALMTVGKGQRIGIFSGSGVGKSVLLGMMTRYTSADIVVVGLIGERGREVKEFIEEILGEEGLRKSVVVAAPADTSPLQRVNGAALATTIAEYYRDQGYNVLLIIDSLTRYAQAQREISLSVGEFPATKGFTPSVFAKLSQLMERSGNGAEGSGSITAFYTVLVEGDDHNDPIADHARSVLDGHIVLSRHLADAGHYPAIDIEKSISRVMTSIVDREHLAYSLLFKKFYSSYVRNQELVNVGMYQHGADKVLDQALRYKDNMEAFLRQGTTEAAYFDESIQGLMGVFASEEAKS